MEPAGGVTLVLGGERSSDRFLRREERIVVVQPLAAVGGRAATIGGRGELVVGLEAADSLSGSV